MGRYDTGGSVSGGWISCPVLRLVILLLLSIWGMAAVGVIEPDGPLLTGTMSSASPISDRLQRIDGGCCGEEGKHRKGESRQRITIHAGRAGRAGHAGHDMLDATMSNRVGLRRA